MQIDHRLQPIERIRIVLERLDDIGLGQVETVIEHRIKQTLFARDVVIKTSFREPSGRGHITHRSIVIAFPVKDLRGNLEYPIPGEIAVSAAPLLPLLAY